MTDEEDYCFFDSFMRLTPAFLVFVVLIAQLLESFRFKLIHVIPATRYFDWLRRLCLLIRVYEFLTILCFCVVSRSGEIA